MFNIDWSWFLVALSVVGLFAVPRYPRAGWTWLIWSVVPWNLYALYTDQMGFMLGNLIYMVVYLRNWRISVRQAEGLSSNGV